MNPNLVAGPGRPKGMPNKATTKAREAIASFVDGNSDRIQSWLDEIYEAKGPQAALDSFLGFLEFHVPKLARTEVSGPDGGDINLNIRSQDKFALEHYKNKILSDNT